MVTVAARADGDRVAASRAAEGGEAGVEAAPLNSRDLLEQSQAAAT